jgi:hypothetical protein
MKKAMYQVIQNIEKQVVFEFTEEDLLRVVDDLEIGVEDRDNLSKEEIETVLSNCIPDYIDDAIIETNFSSNDIIIVDKLTLDT